MSNNSIQTAKSDIDLGWRMFLALVAVGVFVMTPFDSFASSSPFATVLCNIVNMVTGPTGGALATVAVLVIGLGALLGKVSWGIALIVAIGIAIIFGAGTIVTLIAGASAMPCLPAGR